MPAQESSVQAEAGTVIRPRAISHVVLNVRDLDRAGEFYTGVLGFTEVARHDRLPMRFYSADGSNHHDLATFQVGEGAGGPDADRIGMNHFAVRLVDEENFKQAYHMLRERGIAVNRTADHRASHGIYLNDPDGNAIELVLDRPREEWEHIPNAVAYGAPLEID
ncbi:MAG: VOC family protein [Dehalococcoidia bacterium]